MAARLHNGHDVHDVAQRLSLGLARAAVRDGRSLRHAKLPRTQNHAHARTDARTHGRTHACTDARARRACASRVRVARARRAHFPRVRRHVCGGMAASRTLPSGRIIDRRMHATRHCGHTHCQSISEVGTRFDADGSLAKQLNSQVFCGNPQVVPSFLPRLRGSVEQTKQHVGGGRDSAATTPHAVGRSVVRCGCRGSCAADCPFPLHVGCVACCKLQVEGIVRAHAYIYRYIDM